MEPSLQRLGVILGRLGAVLGPYWVSRRPVGILGGSCVRLGDPVPDVQSEGGYN